MSGDVLKNETLKKILILHLFKEMESIHHLFANEQKTEKYSSKTVKAEKDSKSLKIKK